MHYQATEYLYADARGRGRRGQIWSALTGRSRQLLALAEIEHNSATAARHYRGIQTVSISHIWGSQGRSLDFDRDFNPIQDHTKERWLNVAAARHQGKSLPPVKLIQAGDIYFVLDGHHRISVAQALGQQEIEAEVTVCRLSGPLSLGHNPTSQGTEVEQLYRKMKDHSARLKERFLLGFHKLSIGVGATARVSSSG